jgi:fatty acid synthase subunit beta
MRPWRHVAFTDQTLHAGPGALRAGLATSLGFGHVGAIALILHPAAFVAQLDGAERERYRALTARRAADARDAWARVWMNQQPAFTRRADRRFDAADGTACSGKRRGRAPPQPQRPP